MGKLMDILINTAAAIIVPVTIYQSTVEYLNCKSAAACLVNEEEIVSVTAKDTIPKFSYKEDIKRIKKLSLQDYQSVINGINTVSDAEIYCERTLSYDQDIILYNKGDYMASFKKIHEKKKDDCDGYATAAAALLSDNGYPAYLLSLRRKNNNGHMIFLYKKDGKFGSIGQGWQNSSRPTCDTVSDLVKKISKNTKIHYDTYKIYNLSKENLDFIDKDRNHDPKRKYEGPLDKIFDIGESILAARKSH